MLEELATVGAACWAAIRLVSCSQTNSRIHIWLATQWAYLELERAKHFGDGRVNLSKEEVIWVQAYVYMIVIFFTIVSASKHMPCNYNTRSPRFRMPIQVCFGQWVSSGVYHHWSKYGTCHYSQCRNHHEPRASRATSERRTSRSEPGTSAGDSRSWGGSAPSGAASSGRKSQPYSTGGNGAEGTKVPLDVLAIVLHSYIYILYIYIYV